MPPRLSLSNWVKTESLYGMWEIFFVLFYSRAVITFLKACKDMLIFLASVFLSPTAPVWFKFYDPAKSTKFIFEDLITMFPSIICFVSRLSVKMEWDREDVAFILVGLVILDKFPFLACLLKLSSLSMKIYLRSSTKNPYFAISLTFLKESLKRSLTFSL